MLCGNIYHIYVGASLSSLFGTRGGVVLIFDKLLRWDPTWTIERQLTRIRKDREICKIVHK